MFAEKDNCTQAYQDPITGKITNVTIATIARTSPTTWSVTQAAGLPPPPSKSTNINYFGGCKMTITDDHGGIATATISSYEFAVVIQ